MQPIILAQTLDIFLDFSLSLSVYSQIDYFNPYYFQNLILLGINFFQTGIFSHLNYHPSIYNKDCWIQCFQFSF